MTLGTRRWLASALVAAGVFFGLGVAADERLKIPAGGVAQITIEGGYTLASAPQAHGVTIFEDGRVKHFNVWGDGRQERRLIARIAKSSVRALKGEVENLGPSPLVKTNPDAPTCADGPRKTYLACNRHGIEIELLGEFDCVGHGRKDGAWTATPAVLDGLERLAHL